MSLTIETDGAIPCDEFAVRARELSVFYGARAALQEASFVIPVGSTTAVIGPNGSGKSTLLGAIAGLNEARSGVLEVPAANRRGGVALVLQATDVERSLPLTVRETVQIARYPLLGLLGRSGPRDRAAVDSALERVGMGDHGNAQLHELSGGQRQRVLVAQGLAQQGEVLLLDEPLTGLDIPSVHTISDAMTNETRAGRTVIFSTHDLGDAASADQVILLDTRQVAFGAPGVVLDPGPLAEAFGGNLLHLEDDSVWLDDPHHFHGHHH